MTGFDRLSVVGCQFSIGGFLEDAMPRVLVVDDEPDAVELLQEFLTAKGYEVIAASDGEEALRKVKEDRPHLILLDIRMPKMNGIEVLKRVREIDREVGVIMVTAVNEEETGRQALQLGAFDYITKPLDLKYLERSLWYKITTMTL
jgi:DNA-binding response OmpR family regulator